MKLLLTTELTYVLRIPVATHAARSKRFNLDFGVNKANLGTRIQHSTIQLEFILYYSLSEGGKSCYRFWV